jgi:hypothetical protein
MRNPPSTREAVTATGCATDRRSLAGGSASVAADGSRGRPAVVAARLRNLVRPCANGDRPVAPRGRDRGAGNRALREIASAPFELNERRRPQESLRRDGFARYERAGSAWARCAGATSARTSPRTRSTRVHIVPEPVTNATRSGQPRTSAQHSTRASPSISIRRCATCPLDRCRPYDEREPVALTRLALRSRQGDQRFPSKRSVQPLLQNSTRTIRPDFNPGCPLAAS